MCRWFDSAPGHHHLTPDRSRLGVFIWVVATVRQVQCPPSASQEPSLAPTVAVLAYDGLMHKRWILYLVLVLLIGRAWGLHPPSMTAQDAPCHGQAVHGHHAVSAPAHAPLADPSDHAAGHGEGEAVAQAGSQSSEASADAMQGEGHVCCLVLVGVQQKLWPAGLVPIPDRPEPRWASASRGPDLRPPIQAL